jgi:hypothetical protein
LIEAGRFV